MFALYINDFPSLVSSQLLLFAYDVKLYHCICSVEDCFVLQNDINIMLNWSKHWLLSFNVSKCKVLHIGSTSYNGNYTLDGIQLELLDNFCDLGMQIDSKLKFYIHTNAIVKKAYHVLRLICKSFKCKDYDVMVKLYKTLICPIIEYTVIMFYGDLSM